MPKLNWINLFGLGSVVACVLLGLAVIGLTGQVTQLSCNRLRTTEVNCRLQRHFLGLIPAHQREIAHVSGVELGGIVLRTAPTGSSSWPARSGSG